MVWKDCLFDDFVRLNRGFDLPNDQIVEGHYPVVASTSIKAYHNEWKIKGPGVVTGRSGSLGTVQYIKGNFWPLNTSLYVKDFKGNDPLFVYYFLQIMHLENFNAGAGVPTLNQNHLHKLIIHIPATVDDQKRISSILYNYEELIENNSNRILLLEGISRDFYKEWFVRMRFPGYKNALFEKGKPKEWRVLKVTDLLDVKYGKDHKHLEDGDVPSYGSGGIMRMVNRKLYSGESVLIPRKGSLNNVMLVHDDLWTIDTMFYTIAKMPHVAAYAYYILSSIDMESFNTGAALPSMSIDILASMKVLVPNPELLEQFDSLVQPIFREIELLKKQNTQLLSAKDYLLPRLMSGKLSIE